MAILICAMVKSRYIGDGHPTFNRNPYNGYINPYYWVDDHPLLYGNNGSLDPGTYNKSWAWNHPTERSAISINNLSESIVSVYGDQISVFLLGLASIPLNIPLNIPNTYMGTSNPPMSTFRNLFLK